MNRLLQYIRETGRSYCPPASCELAGQTLSAGGRTVSADECICVKCAEDLFLIPQPQGALLHDAAAGRTLDAEQPEEISSCGELNGWHGSLHLAPGRTAECDFGDGVLYFEGEEIPAPCYAAGERLCLLSLPDGLVLVLDMARFLFYGAADGRPFGGNITNMKLN